MTKARFVKSALRLAAETALMSTVGSLFWMLIGKDVVAVQAGGRGWEYADPTSTFTHFFMAIAPLYLLYRGVQFVLTKAGRKAGKAVDSGLSDVGAYTRLRSRVSDVLQDEPQSQQQSRVPQQPNRCYSCDQPEGHPHLIGCQRNGR